MIEQNFITVDSIRYAYRLRFPGEFEAQFLTDYSRHYLVLSRVALFVAMILYGGFGLLDIWAMPISKNDIWFIRYVIVCPAIGMALLASFFSFFERWMQIFHAIPIVLGGFGIIAMIAISHKQESGYTSYYAGLMLVMLYGFTFVRLRFKYATAYSLIIICGYEIVAIVLQQFWTSTEGIHMFINNNFFFLSTVIIGMVACYFMEVYSRRDFLQRLIIEFEQRQAEQLLLNILPEEIAMRLKKNQQIIADHFENVSVLFADIVNFTPLSEKLEPKALVQLLNKIFSHLDALVEKYGLEKIKTIGDCYMVAAGIPTSHFHHAQAIVNLAMDIREYAANHPSQDGTQLAFRIGIASGPVVAGVIGLKKFIYDLWGDTVNTASRMESHGESGKIQITNSTYELINNEFICEPGSRIKIKGKGEMQVWHVIAKRRNSHTA